MSEGKEDKPLEVGLFDADVFLTLVPVESVQEALGVTQLYSLQDVDLGPQDPKVGVLTDCLDIPSC